jgi:hypothetical protein
MAASFPRVVQGFARWLSGFSKRTLWAIGSLGFGLAAGLGSGVYALNTIGLTAAASPKDWQEWVLSDGSTTLPYALGHFLAAGQVPPSRASRQFIRRVDDSGAALSGSCAVTLQGALPPARWWTLAATASNGKVGESRGVLSAGEAVLEANGQLRAQVSASPAAGNWIVPPGNGSYILVLTVHDAASVSAATLPPISQGGC